MCKIKICGITECSALPAINTALPDYAGFIMTAGFKRSVTEDFVRECAKVLDPRIKRVGVFVNDDARRIARLVKEGVINVVQLHGDEDGEYIKRLKNLCPVTVIKAVGVEGGRVLPYPEECDIVLLDATDKNARGGTGKRIEWRRYKFDKSFILAGGITDGNVREAIAAVGPWGVDSSGGLETDGKKDAEKIYRYVANVRECRHMDKESKKGRFGAFGGQYVPETLMSALEELEQAYKKYSADEQFNAELKYLLDEYAGRPSRLYFARNLTRFVGGCKIYLKREDLNHTGAHKINNALGQALLAKKMGKNRLIAETGAGQHGVATATAAALLGMECEIYMGEEDTKRQALNVYRMKLLGAKVHAVTSGTRTLKDAVNECMREWTNRIADTHYCLGSVMGPHPFPTIVRDFQAVISEEAREQILSKEGKLPAAVVACVGGGSNAIGAFYHFIGDKGVRLIGCEAAGRGIDTLQTAATVATGKPGIFHGMFSLFCQDSHGQIAPVYSISAGLDYPGIGPEHAYLHDIGRAEYVPVTDDEAVEAFGLLSRTEGIIPAIESAHAVSYALKVAKEYGADENIIVCLSGRGDKDVAAIARYKGENIYDCTITGVRRRQKGLRRFYHRGRPYPFRHKKIP